MSHRKLFSLSKLLENYFSVEEKSFSGESIPRRILVIRQHNQFGDLLASVSLFRAIKETYPEAVLTVIASPANYYAVTNNEFIDRLFIFNKAKVWNPFYLLKLKKILRDDYDIAIVPATVAISSTSCILAALSDAKFKIGPKSLNEKGNDLASVFNYKIVLDWRKYPDAHVSDFILDIVRPIGINTKNHRSSISFGPDEEKAVAGYLDKINFNGDHCLIGLHVGAGKPPNRWSLYKYISLIKLLGENFKVKLYITGSRSDHEEISFMKSNMKTDVHYFLDRKIPELACLIDKSDLFITNDTGVMHVAGATKTAQISIFGPTNPFNWAPSGENKYFVKKSDLIDDVTVDDVFSLCKHILVNPGNKK